MKAIDYGLLAQRAARKRRGACTLSQHVWQPGPKNTEVCMRCRDVFPCKGVCDHIDCIFRRVELGTLERPHAIGGITVTERHGPAEIVVLDTTSDDPLEWVWPGDWS